MDNRDRYRLLLKTYGITQAKSAGLVAVVTQRPCAERTVRSWLNDPDKPSSTPCPDWAVAALEKAIEYMQRALAQRNKDRQQQPAQDGLEPSA